jgi:hypothetical protein
MDEDLAKIRDVLNADWDPIGVFPDGATDEYDSYAPRPYAMLVTEQPTAEEIQTHLTKIVVEQMGIEAGLGVEECCRQTALALLALRLE